MPRNRRSRRNFEKKYRSGVWKACAGASAMAAVIAVQTGVAPAFAAPTTRVVDLNREDTDGTSALSLREAIGLANPGDIIDISGAGDDIWVDGPITIDTSITIVGAGDGVQKIHSYARTASDWGFNELNLNLGDDVDGAGDDFFDNNANDYDTVVGNTIFEIVEQIDNATEEVIESTVIFKDVAISGFAAYDGLDNEINEGQYHNYTALVTVNEDHLGEVIFDSATLEDSYVTSMAKGYNIFSGTNEQMYVWFAAASGIANYSYGTAEGGADATKISFINDSQIYNLNTNTVADWDDQFSTISGDDYGDNGGVDRTVIRHWDMQGGDGFYGDAGDGNRTYTAGITNITSSQTTQSAVFSRFGDIEFLDSSAENNSVYSGDLNGTWFNQSSDGAVFGIFDANLIIKDSTIVGNSHEDGDGGVAYLDIGNLYISSLSSGQTDISYNFAYNGEGGAFSVDDGKFEISGDVVFSNNRADQGGAIYADDSDEFSFIGDGVEFHNNKASYDGGAVFVDGKLRVAGSSSYGVEFDNNMAYDGSGGAIYQKDGYFDVLNASFYSNGAYDDGGEGFTGRGGAIFVKNVWDLSKTTLRNVDFSGNYSEFDGGAVALSNWSSYYDDPEIYGRTDLVITGSAFHNNYSGDEGGALYIDAVVETKISDTSFTFNESDEDGGAIYFNTSWVDNEANSYLTVVDSQFSNNRTEYDGGAIYSDDHLTVQGSSFESNISDNGSGGAIYANDGGSVSTTYFTGNMADDEGGAIYSNGLTLAVYESEFVRNGFDIRAENFNAFGNAYTNEVTEDGGAIHADGSDLLLVNSHFEGNYVNDNGGAVSSFDLEYDVIANGTSFINNYAGDEGSAIYADGDIFAINSTFSENSAESDDYVIYSDESSVYLAMSTIVNEGQDGEDAYLIYADDNLHVFGSIIAANNGSTDLDVDADEFYDDGYNLVTDPSALENLGMDLNVPLDNKSMYVNWSDLDFTQDTTSNWGSYANTMKLGTESVAIRYVRNNRLDVDWLFESGIWFPGESKYIGVDELIKDDARGTHRGNLMDVGSYEVSIMSGGGGSVDATPSEPVVEPTPTPTPEALAPVVANVRGFAPGSAKLTKALKATIKAEVTENAAYKAVVLRGFTVTAADFALAKARATAVKNYLLKLVPDLATKVLKGKLGQSRKVKMTFKETL